MATSPTPTQHQQSSLVLLTHLARLGQRAAQQREQPDGLRPRHFVTLTVLRDRGPLTQAGLAEALQLDPTNVVAVLNDLEAPGYVSRTRDPADRRRHIVEVTADGLAALQREERAYADAEAHVLGGLDEEQRAQLHALLAHAAGQATCVGDPAACAAADDDC